MSGYVEAGYGIVIGSLGIYSVVLMNKSHQMKLKLERLRVLGERKGE